MASYASEISVWTCFLHKKEKENSLNLIDNNNNNNNNVAFTAFLNVLTSSKLK